MSQPLSIGSSSLLIQRALSQAQNAISISTQRLSSGSRLNSAKDDPVAFATAIQLDSQIRGLNQTVKNANEGVSLFQTAESGLTEITDLLQRMRELAVQASGASASDADRAIIQLAVNQLSAQVDTLAASTTYNGKNLLDGSLGNLSFQLGASSDQTVSASISSATTKELSLNAQVLGDLNGGRVAANLQTINISVGDLILNGRALPAVNFTDGVLLPSYAITVGGTSISNYAGAVSGYINGSTSTTGVTANAYNTVKGTTGGSGVTDGTLKINGATVAASTSMSDLVAKINAATSAASAEATATLNSDGSITLSNSTGRDIVISSVAAGNLTNAKLTAGTSAGYVSLTNATASDITWSAANATTALSRLQALGFTTSTGAHNVTGSAASTATLANGDVLINGVSIGASVNGVGATLAAGSAAAKAIAINASTAATGVTATAGTATVGFTLNLQAALTGGDVTINGFALGAGSYNATTIVTAINALGGLTGPGVIASVPTTGQFAGQLLLTATTVGATITVAYNNNGATFLGVAGGAGTSTTVASLNLTTADNSPIRIEDGVAGGAVKLGLSTLGGSSQAASLDLNVTTVNNATTAITAIDAAITSIQNSVSNMGSLQDRFQSSISFLENASEDLSTAKSNITDVDFAAETAALTRAQILQQAGISILAQANAQMQSVLALLK